MMTYKEKKTAVQTEEWLLKILNEYEINEDKDAFIREMVVLRLKYPTLWNILIDRLILGKDK